MRMTTIGLALGFVAAAVATSFASTGGDPAEQTPTSKPTLINGATAKTDDTLVARRSRGSDDPPGDDHGRHHGGKGKGKGGKGRGGHDDGPNHT
ncbi:MAG TPA: hypothetical protein VFK86_19355 [Bauldia sp.]|nr:hypothetical protein [Bauldia sp.]